MFSQRRTDADYFGTGVVNKVYAAFIQAAGVGESSKSEAANIAAKKLNPFQRIARLLSNIFVPIIPAIVASGLLMGLLGMVKPTAGSTRATLSTLSWICAAPRRLLFCRS